MATPPMFSRSMTPSPPPSSVFTQVNPPNLSNPLLGLPAPPQVTSGVEPQTTQGMDESSQSDETPPLTPEQLQVIDGVRHRLSTYQPSNQIPDINPTKEWEDQNGWKVFRLVKDGRPLEWTKGKVIQLLGFTARQKKIFEGEIEDLAALAFPRPEEWMTPFTAGQRGQLLQEMVEVMKRRWGPAFNIPYWKGRARFDTILSDLIRRNLRPSVRKRKVDDNASMITYSGGNRRLLGSDSTTPCPLSRTATPASVLTFPSPSLLPQRAPLVTQFQALRAQSSTPTLATSFDSTHPYSFTNAAIIKTPPKYEQWDTVISIHNHLTQGHILTLNILEIQLDSPTTEPPHFTHGTIMNIDEAKFFRLLKNASPNPSQANFKLRLFLPGHPMHGELRTEGRGLKYLVQIAYNARANPIVFTAEWVHDDGKVVGVTAEGAWESETGKA